jgi:hypothetical protein
MSAVTFNEQVVVRKHVYDYLQKNGMTSLRKVAAYIMEQSGNTPAITTIARLVREYGYEISDVEWKQKQDTK